MKIEYIDQENWNIEICVSCGGEINIETQLYKITDNGFQCELCMDELPEQFND